MLKEHLWEGLWEELDSQSARESVKSKETVLVDSWEELDWRSAHESVKSKETLLVQVRMNRMRWSQRRTRNFH